MLTTGGTGFSLRAKEIIDSALPHRGAHNHVAAAGLSAGRRGRQIAQARAEVNEKTKCNRAAAGLGRSATRGATRNECIFHALALRLRVGLRHGRKTRVGSHYQGHTLAFTPFSGRQPVPDREVVFSSFREVPKLRSSTWLSSKSCRAKCGHYSRCRRPKRSATRAADREECFPSMRAGLPGG